MTSSPHYLYVFNMLGYGKHGNPKVGITKDVAEREKQLWYSYGGLIPKLLALYEFDDIASARRAESAVIRRFTPYLPNVRELFKEPCDLVIEFINASGFPCRTAELP